MTTTGMHLRIENDKPNVLAAAVEQMAAQGRSVGKVRFDVIDIDREFAWSILATHNQTYRPPTVAGTHTRTNRPFHSEYTLTGWAKDMVNGVWILTPQGIAFDTDGNLLDGQNRMKALILANDHWAELIDHSLPDAEQRAASIEKHGVRIPMLVSYDWEPEVFDRIDRGKPRGLSDLLAVTGESDRHYLASTGRLVWSYDQDPSASRVAGSEHTVLEFIKANQPWMSEAVADSRLITGANRARLLGSGAAAAIFVIRRAWPRTQEEIESETDRVGEFLHGLGNGFLLDGEGRRMGMPPGDARAALRGYLTSKTGLNDRDRRRHMGLLIKTWNRWVTRKNVEIMKLLSTEEFPVPVLRDGAEWSETTGRYFIRPARSRRTDNHTV